MKTQNAWAALVALVFASAGCSGGGEAAETNRDLTTQRQPASWRIAFTSYIDGDPDIYVMNANGSGRRPLTLNEEDDADVAVWSPEGSEIAFQRTPANTPDVDLYVVNADGSGERRLTNEGGYLPAWSPDGTQIAFGSSRDNQAGDIYVMNADGSAQSRLTTSRKFFFSGLPAWSPDGTKIAFLSDRHHLESSAIYLMDADGSDETRLTHARASDGSQLGRLTAAGWLLRDSRASTRSM